jgi:hypothetical protein
MTHSNNSCSLDSDRWRIRIQVGDAYRYHDLGTTDFFTAEMIADAFRNGHYIDKALLDRVSVEIQCPLHGWRDAPWGFCDTCDDNALDALLDLMEADPDSVPPYGRAIDEIEIAEAWLTAGLLSDDDLAGIDDLPF